MPTQSTRRALVTGSSSGFGRDLCTALLERGWTVYATMRRAMERRDLFAEQTGRFGERLRLLSLDVTEPQEREAAAWEVEQGGGLDCLINNAGYGQFGPLEAVGEEDLRRQMEVNFFGAALLTKRLLPPLRASRGRIINVSSIMGLATLPLSSPYCASKFALEGFSEALYHEMKPHGVQVALVEPGSFRTNFSKNVRIAASEPGSVYAGQAKAYLRWRDKRAGRGTRGEAVVRAIVRLVESRRMPLRTLVGLDARAYDAVNRLLPRNAASRLMSGVFGMLERARV